MYERFTDRARRILSSSGCEAQRFFHEFIGTEHILLAMLRDQECLACHLMNYIGLNLRDVRIKLETLIQAGPTNDQSGYKLPMTPAAKRVIEYAMQEARDMGCNYVGTEHILMGLIHVEDCVAANVIMTFLPNNPSIARVIEILKDAWLSWNENKLKKVGHEEEKSNLKSIVDRLESLLQKEHELLEQVLKAIKEGKSQW